jgi:hypothetical protein
MSNRKYYTYEFSETFDLWDMTDWMRDIFNEEFGFPLYNQPIINIEGTAKGFVQSGSLDEAPDSAFEFSDVEVVISDQYDEDTIAEKTLPPEDEDTRAIIEHFTPYIETKAIEKELG